MTDDNDEKIYSDNESSRFFRSNEIWNIEWRFMSFEKSNLYEFSRFFNILNDFNILWFSFLKDWSICMFLMNNQIRFFI
jgi:hypothetical protein